MVPKNRTSYIDCIITLPQSIVLEDSVDISLGNSYSYHLAFSESNYTMISKSYKMFSKGVPPKLKGSI
jgi:hypothetical protein